MRAERLWDTAIRPQVTRGLYVETGGGDLLNRSADIVPLFIQGSVNKDCLCQHFYEKSMYQNDFKSVFII